MCCPPGQEVYRVVTVEDPGAAKASVGDLVKLPVGSVPGTQPQIAGLKVEVIGTAVRFATVAKTPEPKRIGVDITSAFLVAESQGEAKVTVTPVAAGGEKKEPRVYTIKVGPQVD